MLLTHISLEQFRTYQTTAVDFAAGSTVVVGKNAAGKSNLLEAIRLLSTTHPVHATRDAQVIAAGSTFTRVVGRFGSAGREQELVCVIDTATGRTKKLWRLQGAPKMSRAVVGLLTTVLFKPEDVDVLQKSSAARRAVLDQLLVIRNPELFSALQRVRVTLQQRQRLLERVRAGEMHEVDLYDEPLIADGSIISAARANVVTWLRDRFTTYLRSIGQNPEAAVRFTLSSPLLDEPTVLPRSTSEWQQVYRRAIAKVRDREIAAGRNLLGPQREDVVIEHNDRLLREYGSRGEWRSAVVSLLLSSADYTEYKTGERPVLLLDDVFSELDERRRAALLPYIDTQQTIITTADEAEIPEVLRRRAARLCIQAGKITTPAAVLALS